MDDVVCAAAADDDDGSATVVDGVGVLDVSAILVDGYIGSESCEQHQKKPRFARISCIPVSALRTRRHFGSESVGQPALRTVHAFGVPGPHSCQCFSFADKTKMSASESTASNDQGTAESGSSSASSPASHYTHLILGTSLTLSTLSAALALDPSNKILHVDPQENYGSQHASLTLSQLVEFVKGKGAPTTAGGPRAARTHLSFPFHASSEIPPELLHLDRHYSLSLSPALQPAAATSPSLDTLVRSNVARYATFRLLQRTALYSNDTLTMVPSSKEDIFKSTSLSLLDKRRLMKFLQFAAGEYTSDENVYIPHAATPFPQFLRESFALPPHLVEAITYGIALATSSQESTSTAMSRIKTHLLSVGRYGNAAYLVAQYGGMGDIVQGYCRASAVKGSTFVLGKDVRKLDRIQGQGNSAAATYNLDIEDIDERFSADAVIAQKNLLPRALQPQQLSTPSPPPSPSTLQSVFILDRGLNIPDDAAASDTPSSPSAPIETALLIFPPASLHPAQTHTTTLLVLGEGTFCCPKGQYVVHATTNAVEAGDVSVLHDAIRGKVLDLARSSPVEWTSAEGANRGDEAETAMQPLFEAYWLQGADDDDGNSNNVVVLNNANAAASAHAGPSTTSPPLPSRPPSHIATLFDDCTQDAQRLFYTLHGIHEPPYPNPRRRVVRSEAEYRGRGGVGPDHEQDEQDDADDAEQGSLPPLFFPVDGNEAGDNDDDEQR